MLTIDSSVPASKFSALADPRRREIFESLVGGSRSVADIAREMPVTRPAVSQHLKVLMDAGLVRHRVAGTRHLYRIDPAGVGAIRDYLDALWRLALESFKQEAERAYSETKDQQK
jgi:DNA-binding transcriptional ArsR family regulator